MITPETKLLADDDTPKKSYTKMEEEYDVRSFSDLLQKESDVRNGVSGDPTINLGKSFVHLVRTLFLISLISSL